MPLKTRTFPDLFDGAGARISFHFPDGQGLTPGLGDLARDLSFRRGFPDEVFEYSNVFLVADRECSALYDEAGARIDVSAVRRGANPAKFAAARERIAPPTDFRVLDRPVLFLSKHIGHWGHLITEGVSRLWARRRHPELAKLPVLFACGEETEPGPASELFAHFPDLEIVSSRDVEPPLKLARAFVPAPSFVNLASAYSGHRAALHEAADRMLAGKIPQPNAQPVYFSRTQLPNYTRSFENEIELESALEARGFRIVHPQNLDVRSQIELINAHRVFVGVIGSAMHNLFFALRGEEKISHLLCPIYPQRNFRLADAVVGNESHYVCTCRESGANDQREIIDVPTTLAYLRDQGLF